MEVLTDVPIPVAHIGKSGLVGKTESQASDERRTEAEWHHGDKGPALAFLSIHPLTGEGGHPAAGGSRKRENRGEANSMTPGRITVVFHEKPNFSYTGDFLSASMSCLLAFHRNPAPLG